MRNLNEALFLNEENQKLSQILMRIFEESLRLFKDMAEKTKDSQRFPLEELLYFNTLYKNFMIKMLEDPIYAINAQVAYWKDYLDLWQKSVVQMMDEKGLPSFTSSLDSHPQSLNDKRFKDMAWEEHPFFNFIKEFYFLTAKHIQKSIQGVKGVDKKTIKKIEFYTRNFIEALAPTNFILTNPEVLRETLNSNGENLLKGMRNFLKDMERSKEIFQISMTDLSAFQVGRNLAITPGKVIYQNDLMQLIQYAPQTETVYKIPLLIIPSWINKYYILDLSEKNSFVNWLVQQGYTVFMISWVNAESKHTHKEFEDYMKEGPLTALSIIEQAIGEKKVNSLGYCIGGTLLACVLAYQAQKNQNRILSGSYITTLLDFADAGDLSAFLDEDQISLYERKMLSEGYLNGAYVALSFNMLRANDLIWSYFVRNYLLGKEPFPFDMLYWNADATNLPAKMHSFYMRGMYLENLLIKPNGLKLAGVPINLEKIKVPLYFLSTQHDHIIPWESTYRAIKAYTCPITYVLGGSGHVAGVINHPAMKKYNYYLNDVYGESPQEWLSASQSYEGSWWPHWEKWLQERSGGRVQARFPEQGNIDIIEDAPGSYVKKRLFDSMAA